MIEIYSLIFHCNIALNNFTISSDHKQEKKMITIKKVILAQKKTV